MAYEDLPRGLVHFRLVLPISGKGKQKLDRPSPPLPPDFPGPYLTRPTIPEFCEFEDPETSFRSRSLPNRGPASWRLHLELLVLGWLEAGRLFEDAQQISRAIDSIAFRIACLV